MRFCTLTLGCKVNQYETQSLEAILTARGYIEVQAGQGCDVCVINTCAVTVESVRKSAQAVRRIKKLEPEAIIVVCGCLPKLEPEKITDLGADIIAEPGEKQALADEIETLLKSDLPTQIQIEHFYAEDTQVDNAGTHGGRTRALLKIQDGCDNFCAYCVIPYARGRVKSELIGNIADEARRLKSAGFLEIVVTGIEIASYGKDLAGGETLTDAVRAIGDAAPGVRLRLGSIDPGIVTERFCAELSANVNICNHFHLSLQSGCDETLRRMNRKYDTAAVSAAIARLRHYFPDCGITADLITGFPGETDDEFAQTLEFIRAAKFSDMHIFPFSPRQGTTAFDMPGGVSKSVRRERAQKAARIAGRNALKFKLSQIGKTADVLFERERDGCWCGHAANYLEIRVPNGGNRNTIHPVQITGVENGVIWGEII